jgi:ADP-heptose:LPS heptosyltransferase
VSETGLVVKTHAFGDAMLTTPAVRELISSERSVSSWRALAGPSSRAVWDRFPGIGQVMTAPFPPSHGNAGRFRLMMWSLRARPALKDVSSAWIFHSSPELRRWVRFLTGARIISGGDRPLGDWEEARGFDPAVFAGESYALIAGVTPGSWRPEFPCTSEELEEARELLGQGRWFALAPGGGKNPRDTVLHKRWSLEGYTEVASRLAGAGYGLLLLGGPGDRGVSEVLVSGLSPDSARVLDMTGKTDWGLTTALIGSCGFFLGNDSGTAHASVAAGARTAVVFGPTDPGSLYAPGAVYAITSGSDCSPCYSNRVFPGCPHPGNACMAVISADTVWGTVERMLDEDNSA